MTERHFRWSSGPWRGPVHSVSYVRRWALLWAVAPWPCGAAGVRRRSCPGLPRVAARRLPETECASCHPPTGGATERRLHLLSRPGSSPLTTRIAGTATSRAPILRACPRRAAPAPRTATSTAISTGATSRPYTHGASPHDGASGFGLRASTATAPAVSIIGPRRQSAPRRYSPAGSPTCDRLSPSTSQEEPRRRRRAHCHDGMNIPPRPAACNDVPPDAASSARADCTSPAMRPRIHNDAPDVGTCQSCHVPATRSTPGSSPAPSAIRASEVLPSQARRTTEGQGLPELSCEEARRQERLPGSKCASCHKGNAPAAKPPALSTRRPSRRSTPARCATRRGFTPTADGARNITCRSCHKGKFHASQATPSNSVCTSCHSSARHARQRLPLHVVSLQRRSRHEPLMRRSWSLRFRLTHLRGRGRRDRPHRARRGA